MYRPSWADHKLSFKLDVFNAFNEQTPTQYISSYESVSWQRITNWEDPRYVRFSIAYDW
jgi:hypothetical protein